MMAWAGIRLDWACSLFFCVLRLSPGLDITMLQHQSQWRECGECCSDYSSESLSAFLSLSEFSVTNNRGHCIISLCSGSCFSDGASVSPASSAPSGAFPVSGALISGDRQPGSQDTLKITLKENAIVFLE